MTEIFTRNYLEHKELFERVFNNCELLKTIDECPLLINKCFENGGKVLIFGNGGSAADSMHITAEFVGSFKQPKKPLNVICLNTNQAAMTSIANDSGYENIFSKQIEAYVKNGDIVIGLTTSGKSKNVIKAFEKAKELGATGIALCGENSEKLCADKIIGIPSSDTPRIQEVHLFIGHYWAQRAEDYFENGDRD